MNRNNLTLAENGILYILVKIQIPLDLWPPSTEEKGQEASEHLRERQALGLTVLPSLSSLSVLICPGVSMPHGLWKLHFFPASSICVDVPRYGLSVTSGPDDFTPGSSMQKEISAITAADSLDLQSPPRGPSSADAGDPRSGCVALAPAALWPASSGGPQPVRVCVWVFERKGRSAGAPFPQSVCRALGRLCWRTDRVPRTQPAVAGDGGTVPPHP